MKYNFWQRLLGLDIRKCKRCGKKFKLKKFHNKHKKFCSKRCRVCVSALNYHHRHYYLSQSFRDKKLKKNKEGYQRNRAKRLKHQKEYYQENKEKKQEYYLENKEKIRKKRLKQYHEKKSQNKK